MTTVGNAPADFERDMRAERARWAEVVKQRKISVK
jgi:hypothetical protein